MKSSVEIIGEERFKNICERRSLTTGEEIIIKEILKEWDQLMSVKDNEERMVKKIRIAKEKIVSIEPLRRTNVLLCCNELVAIIVEIRLNSEIC